MSERVVIYGSRTWRGPAADPRVVALGAGSVRGRDFSALERDTQNAVLNRIKQGSTAKKRPKYGNQPVEYDGRRFASKRERDRYHTLKRRQEAGEIEDLECQVLYRFVVNGVKVGRYTADYRYRVVETGESVVEDAKGARPRDWYRTKQLMKACHGIEVMEV